MMWIISNWYQFESTGFITRFAFLVKFKKVNFSENANRETYTRKYFYPCLNKANSFFINCNSDQILSCTQFFSLEWAIQLAFTRSKLTTETLELEQGVKYVQSYQ